MISLENIFNKINGYRDEIIRLQSELTSRPALSPENGGTGEHDKAEFIRSLMESLKPDLLDEIRAPDERARGGYRPSLLAKWGQNQKAPAVWSLGHMDVVPPGDLSLWETDPYQVEVKGDKIIGRGVEDNQHGIISSFLALKAIIDSGEEIKRPIGLICVADEETGSKFGLDYLLRHHQDYFKEDDLIIVPDYGREDGSMIEVAEKSMLWLKFTVKGRQCHASTPHKGRNTLYGAARMIVALQALKEKFADRNPLFRPKTSTFEPTKIEANVPNINTIPGMDVFYLDCRILPDYDVSGIIQEAKKIVDDIAQELELEVKLAPTYQQDAVNPTPVDAPVVKALSQAIKDVIGIEASPTGIGGGTVAAFFRQAGLQAAVWSTLQDTAHQPNEYCLISDIMSDAKVFAHLFMNVNG